MDMTILHRCYFQGKRQTTQQLQWIAQWLILGWICSDIWSLSLVCLFHNEFILFVAQYKFSPEKYHSQHFTRDLRCEIILTLESIYGSALFYNSANLNLW